MSTNGGASTGFTSHRAFFGMTSEQEALSSEAIDRLRFRLQLLGTSNLSARREVGT
jgi:hypothetical protein